MPKLTDLPFQAAAKIQQYAERGAAELHYARKMFEAGALKLEPPQNIAAFVADIRRWGEFGMIPALNARRTPNRTAVVDDDGEITFKELDDAAHAVANGLLAMGVKGGDGVAILARNHRWFLIALYGAARVGARIILLNSEFSGPQIKEVSEREGAKVIIYDDEYTKAVAQAEPPQGKLRALGTNPDKDEPSGSTDETLADLIERSSSKPAPEGDQALVDHHPDQRHHRNAQGRQPQHPAVAGADRRRAVARAVQGQRGDVAARADVPRAGFPARHDRDDARLDAGAATTVQARDRARRHREEQGDGHGRRAGDVVAASSTSSRRRSNKPDLSSLRIVFVSGSQLGAELATRALKDLGPVIYNLYGSTEIAFATIARPKDLSINPATVGPVVKGVKVKILDDNGNELPQGEVGRIFVGNTFPFEGYTGGGHKQIIDGLMSSGDVGYFDEHNLLYVSGRDDEMIVSGGENVFPAEVEDLISGHPEVVEATALGVEDKDWGHRLRAFVVKTDGASVDEDAIKTYVKENLARYKVPREVVFLDELPRNPTGKILKRELREMEVE